MASAVDIRALARCAHHGKRNHLGPAVPSDNQSDSMISEIPTITATRGSARVRGGLCQVHVGRGLLGGDHE